MASRKPSERSSGTWPRASLSACTKETSHATRSGPVNSRRGNRSGASAESDERPLLFDSEPARKYWRRATPWLALKRGKVRVAFRRNGEGQHSQLSSDPRIPHTIGTQPVENKQILWGLA